MGSMSATVSHVFDVDYMSGDKRAFFGFEPSRNDWHTTTSGWMSLESGLREARRILECVETQITDLFPGIIENIKIVEGEPFLTNLGAICFEKTLTGRVNGDLDTFAKVLICYGRDAWVEEWVQFERNEWFGEDI